MNPRDFLEIAKRLLKNDTPAHCRTAFNRCYYAAYNVGVELLEATGVSIAKSFAGHGDVNKCFGNCGIRELEETQSKLTMLANQRIKADYRLRVTAVEKIDNARKAVITSGTIIEIFDLYNSNSGRKKILDGINAYDRKIKSASKSAPKVA